MGVASLLRDDKLLLLAITAVGAAIFSIGLCIGCFFWVRRENRRMQRKILQAVADAGHDQDDLFLTGRDIAVHGELVAQFKVNHGKQVVSLVESDGRRFIHVDGPLSAPERAKMVRYLKSEGFMS